MKIVKAIGESFEFVYDKHTKFHFGEEGTSVSDLQARVINERYGALVTIEDATIAEVVNDALSGAGTIPAAKELSEMNKKELLARAEELKIEVAETMTKAEIVAAIEAGLAAPAAPAVEGDGLVPTE